MGALCACTAGGNALVLRALWRAAPRAPAHYLLTSLALADFLLGLTVLPLSTAREIFTFHLEHTWCASWRTLDVLCCTASILSICALGWERHAGVTRPLDRVHRSRRARLLAVLVWPASALVAVPSAFVPSPAHHRDGEMMKACSVNINIGYVFFSSTFSFYLPAGIMMVLYWRVIRSLSALPPLRAHRGGSREQDNIMVQKSVPSPLRVRSPAQSITREPVPEEVFLSPKGQHLGLPTFSMFLGDLLSPSRSSSPIPDETGDNNSCQECSATARQVRATRTIVLLMSLFLFCWTPFFIMLPIDATTTLVNPIAFSCCTWLGWANSALNPVIYAATSPAVRRALQMSISSSGSRPSDIPMAIPRPYHV